MSTATFEPVTSVFGALLCSGETAEIALFAGDLCRTTCWEARARCAAAAATASTYK